MVAFCSGWLFIRLENGHLKMFYFSLLFFVDLKSARLSIISYTPEENVGVGVFVNDFYLDVGPRNKKKEMRRKSFVWGEESKIGPKDTSGSLKALLGVWFAD